MADSTDSDSNSNQLVVLIHGLASSRWLMHPLRFRLKQRGFQVRTYSYFTFGGNIDAIAHRFSNTLAEWAVVSGANQVHIVAHSMGAIVTRRLLLEPIAFPLGKVVMLAPPHHGSHVATRLSKPLSAICPALHRLADTPGSYVRQLGIPQGHDIGVIAADGDLVVRKQSTRLGTERDFYSLPGMHTGVLFRNETAVLVERFLRTGKFAAE